MTKFNKLNVLIVENHLPMIDALTDMLLSLGFKQVYVAKSNANAIDILSKQKVDLIISEFEYEHVNAIELIRSLKKNQQAPSIPFVIASATTNYSSVSAAAEHGVSEYIVKPFSFSILEKRLSKALKCKPTSANSQIVLNKQFTIMVVDDNKEILAFVNAVLKPTYNLTLIKNPTKVPKLCLQHKQPDLIILDIDMPSLNGFELASELQRHPKTRHIPFIFLSGKSDSQHVVKGYNLGADGYIAKPIVASELRARVHSHCQQLMNTSRLREHIDDIMTDVKNRENVITYLHSTIKEPLLALGQQFERLYNSGYSPNLLKNVCEGAQFKIKVMMEQLDLIESIQQLEQNKYSYPPCTFALTDLINYLVKQYETRFVESKVAVSLSLDHMKLNCVEPLIKGALVQILNNAIEGSPPGSQVTIKLTKMDNTAILTVHNITPIPWQVVESFMEKFVTYGKPNHAGLGFHYLNLICKYLAIKLKVESDIKTGTFVSMQWTTDLG